MINIIVAQGENREIGYKNKLLCHLPKDLKHFKETTMGHTVVMGRKTFESIGRPLKGRENIVLSSRTDLSVDEDVIVTNDIDSILKLNLKYPSKQIFIIGGESVYLQFLSYTSKIYLTQIHHTFENADTRFPYLPDIHWKVESEKFFEADEDNPYDFTIKVYKRKMVSCLK